MLIAERLQNRKGRKPESRSSELLVAVKARQRGEGVSQKKPSKNQFYRLQEETGKNVLSLFSVNCLHKTMTEMTSEI